jgi:hypothetical protein
VPAIDEEKLAREGAEQELREKARVERAKNGSASNRVSVRAAGRSSMRWKSEPVRAAHDTPEPPFSTTRTSSPAGHEPGRRPVPCSDARASPCRTPIRSGRDHDSADEADIIKLIKSWGIAEKSYSDTLGTT